MRNVSAHLRKNSLNLQKIEENMPVSKNALIRYRTIDRCLRNHYRKWTLADLIDACSDALSEYEGRDENVSRRTVQADIQMMRSDKLGYNAPIVVRENRYYTYEDPEYSITDVPLSSQDTELLSEAVGILKQLSGFSALSGIEDIIGRLEDHVSAARHEKRPLIWFEKNDSLVGLHHLMPLYEAISGERPVLLSYRSFRNPKASSFVFSGYVLKEFRNRWFVFGRREGQSLVVNLALDRIVSMEKAPEGSEYIPMGNFNPEKWFSDMIGVTKDRTMKPQKVVFRASPKEAPYIRTKPLHRSQMVIEEDMDGYTTFQLEVIVNPELERDLLAYGCGITVLSPQSLVESIRRHHKAALNP